MAWFQQGFSTQPKSQTPTQNQPNQDNHVFGLDFEKYEVSAYVRKLLIFNATSSEESQNYQKIIAGKNIKVKEANLLLRKIMCAITPPQNLEEQAIQEDECGEANSYNNDELQEGEWAEDANDDQTQNSALPPSQASLNENPQANLQANLQASTSATPSQSATPSVTPNTKNKERKKSNKLPFHSSLILILSLEKRQNKFTRKWSENRPYIF